MNTENELKPCPFCGGEAKESSPESNGSKYWQITCQSCYARIGGTHRGMNREAWNTRATHGTLTAEQVREAIFNGSSYASYDGAKYYADGIGMQAIADELNAELRGDAE